MRKGAAALIHFTLRAAFRYFKVADFTQRYAQVREDLLDQVVVEGSASILTQTFKLHKLILHQKSSFFCSKLQPAASPL